jgi:hypothetical protein
MNSDLCLSSCQDKCGLECRPITKISFLNKTIGYLHYLGGDENLLGRKK